MNSILLSMRQKLLSEWKITRFYKISTSTGKSTVISSFQYLVRLHGPSVMRRINCVHLFILTDIYVFWRFSLRPFLFLFLFQYFSFSSSFLVCVLFFVVVETTLHWIWSQSQQACKMRKWSGACCAFASA